MLGDVKNRADQFYIKHGNINILPLICRCSVCAEENSLSWESPVLANMAAGLVLSYK